VAADVYRQRPVADALIGDKLAESRRLVGAPGIVSVEISDIESGEIE
jgi:transcription elongation GreA/GreB family factor